MIKFIDVTGKTEDEAIQSALAQLGMDRDDVSVEILERAKAGFLGIGSAPARVRVSYDDGKAEEVNRVLPDVHMSPQEHLAAHGGQLLARIQRDAAFHPDAAAFHDGGRRIVVKQRTSNRINHDR